VCLVMSEVAVRFKEHLPCACVYNACHREEKVSNFRSLNAYKDRPLI